MIRIIGGGEQTPREKYDKDTINSLIKQILEIDDDTFNKLFGGKDKQEAVFIISQSDEGWFITCGQLVDDNIDGIKELINSTDIQDVKGVKHLSEREYFLKTSK